MLILFIKRLFRVIRFIPKIWYFEWWDHYYLFKCLSEVVKEYRREWLKENRIFSTEEWRLRNVRHLTAFMVILDRLASKEYDENPFYEYTYPKITFIKNNKYPNCSTMKVNYLSEEHEKEVDFKEKKRREFEKKQRNADIDYLCKILKTQSLKWWD